MFSINKGCWDKDPHKRPSFKDVLRELDTIARSGFGETPNESFHTMQDGWKKEIAEVLHELRIKEKVQMAVASEYSKLISVIHWTWLFSCNLMDQLIMNSLLCVSTFLSDLLSLQHFNSNQYNMIQCLMHRLLNHLKRYESIINHRCLSFVPFDAFHHKCYELILRCYYFLLLKFFIAQQLLNQVTESSDF